MGTCMSVYIEIDYSDRLPSFSDPTQVYSLADGSFVLGKDYTVFDVLAGGRQASMRPEDRDSEREPLIPPRGMPSPCSSSVGWDYFRIVADPPELPNKYFWPERLCVSSATAADWRENGGCERAKVHQWFNCESDEIDWDVVSLPGLYNASWLRLDELDTALAHRHLEIDALPIQYGIIRDAMIALVGKYGQERVRLVFWFS